MPVKPKDIAADPRNLLPGSRARRLLGEGLKRLLRQHHESKRISGRQWAAHPGSDGPECSLPTCPSAHANGYEEARRLDGAVADNYVRHTTIGDPELDPVMEELALLPPSEMHRFVRAGVERDDEATLRRAPRALRDFFDNARVPDWVDFGAFKPGQRAFHRNMGNMLIACAVGSAVEGFGTPVAAIRGGKT